MSEPRTIQGDTNGTGVVTYTLPPGVFQYVQAVRAEIDNTAGGTAQPILSISEQSGVVIADAPQSATIPAGESDGASTWALRLTDEGAATPSAGGDVSLLWEYTVPAGGQGTVDTNVDGSLAGLFPQTFKLLEVVGSIRSDNASANAGCRVAFNGDLGNNYDFAFTQVQNAPPSTGIGSSYGTTTFSIGQPAGTSPAANATAFEFEVPNYASTLLNKTARGSYFEPLGKPPTFFSNIVNSFGILWHPAVIVGVDQFVFSATLASNFVEGSFFAVYGRK